MPANMNIKTKADYIDSVPLFLSDEYKKIMGNSKLNFEKARGGSTGESKSTKSKAEKEKEAAANKKKAGSKIYKSRYLEAKLAEQKEKNRKNRGKKNEKAGGADTQRSAAPNQAAGKGKKGKGKGDDKADIEDLEQIIDELNNNLEIKDDQFRIVRDELDQLKENYADMMNKFQKEKFKRVGLEANKLKYIMHKELQQNASTIQEQTFFEKRS